MNNNFLDQNDRKLSLEFEREGYLIRETSNKDSLKKLRKIVVDSIKKKTKISSINDDNLLNNFHKFIKKDKLNEIRLSIIKDINKNNNFRKYYFQVAKDYLDILVGNELAMQTRVNLSIQTPKDKAHCYQFILMFGQATWLLKLLYGFL